MAFDTYEKSDYDSNKIELYEIGDGTIDGTVRLTNHDELLEVLIPGMPVVLTYFPVPINRSGFVIDSDVATSTSIELNIALGTLWEQQLLNLPTFTKVIVRAFNPDDPDLASIIVWKGVFRAIQAREAELVISADKQLKRTEVNGCHRRINRSRCSNVLYGALCRLDEDNLNFNLHSHVVAIPSLSQVEVYSITPLTGMAFLGGVFLYSYMVSGVVTTGFRTITFQDGNLMTLNRPVPANMPEGVATTLRLLMGCDLTFATCRDKFNNEENYIAFDYIPTKAGPFEGGGLM